MKVVLELQDQPSNVRRITVRHDIVIGRGSDCNLRLSAPQVSRRHCFLRVGRDSVSVTDLDSSNGTYVDGIRITAGKRYDIVNGAQLALGPIRFIIHVRTDAEVVDHAKVKIGAGAAKESLRTEAGPESAVPAQSGGPTSGRSRSEESSVPMDYAVEHGGESAEPHEPTADYLDKQFSAAGLQEFFSAEPNPMDSRLEIIDFGRRLAEKHQTAAETGNTSGSDVVNESELIDQVPQWNSAMLDSSDFPDDLDVMSIADDSSEDRSFGEMLTAGPESSLADHPGVFRRTAEDSVETLFPRSLGAANQKIMDEAIEAIIETEKSGKNDGLRHGPQNMENVVDMEEVVDAEEILDVDDEVVEVVDEVIEVVEESPEEAGVSGWFAGDLTEDEIIDAVILQDDADHPRTAESAEGADEIDPQLRDFLKGF